MLFFDIAEANGHFPTPKGDDPGSFGVFQMVFVEGGSAQGQFLGLGIVFGLGWRGWKEISGRLDTDEINLFGVKPFWVFLVTILDGGSWRE